MIDQKHGAAVVAQLANEVAERSRLGRGEAGERLVDQKHLRIARDRFGDLDFAEVGKRQSGRTAVEHAAQADARRDSARAFIGLRISQQSSELVRKERKLDVLQYRLAMQRPRMLKHDARAHSRDFVRRPAGDIDAVDAHRTRIRALDPHDQLHHRGFAGAVRADEAQNFAGADGKRHLLHGDQTAESLGQAGYLQMGAVRHAQPGS